MKKTYPQTKDLDDGVRHRGPHASSKAAEIVGMAEGSNGVLELPTEVESNVPLDVPILMPEHADGSSELKDTEDTAKVESDSCRAGADVHAHIDEASWHTGETETSSRTLIDHCQQLVEMDRPMIAYG